LRLILDKGKATLVVSGDRDNGWVMGWFGYWLVFSLSLGFFSFFLGFLIFFSFSPLLFPLLPTSLKHLCFSSKHPLFSIYL